MSDEPIKIEKGIPMPDKHCWGKWKSLLVKMQPTDSILIPDHNAWMSVLSAAHRLRLKTVSRKTADGKIRLWLIGPKE